MNTSKQINVMIGLLFLSFIAFGAYIVNEPNRQAAAEDAQHETLVHRGAELFVNNCRTCHGLVGLGGEEGAIAPALNNDAFLILGEDNEYGLPPTPEGEARTIRNFLFNTIACGRTNTAMPVWSEQYGGPMSDTQINYLVTLITSGEWDVVEEVGHEHDVEAGTDPAEVVLDPTEAGNLSITNGNCGQYVGPAVREIRERDPFAEPTEEPTGEATPEPTPDDPAAQAQVQGVLVGEFFQNNCAVCHGQNREGLVGPALTPDRLTESDDFYIDTITNGREGTAMPAWGDSAGGPLTPDEVQALVTFLKNVSP